MRKIAEILNDPTWVNQFQNSLKADIAAGIDSKYAARVIRRTLLFEKLEKATTVEELREVLIQIVAGLS